MTDVLFKEFEQTLVNWWENNLDQEHCLIPRDKATEAYTLAYQFYKDKNYKKAIDFFHFLTLLEPYGARNWKGLGASYQMDGQFEKAIEAYVCAQILNKDQPDPTIFVYAADCYFSLEQVESGLKALEGAKRCAQEQKNIDILHHVEFMSERWSNKTK